MRYPLFLNVSHRYPGQDDVYSTAAEAIAEAGSQPLHCDLVFDFGNRQALLIRGPEALIVELYAEDEAPAGFNPDAQGPRLKPLTLKADFKKASCEPRRPTFKDQIRCSVVQSGTKLQIRSDADDTLAEVDLEAPSTPVPHRLILDNSELRKYASVIGPDALVDLCPRYRKKHGSETSATVQYAAQLYLCMATVPHLEHVFMDQVRHVDVRGARYGRLIHMVLHSGTKCSKCTHQPGKDALLLAFEVDHASLEAGAMVLDQKK